ncbi:hypothetical protein BGX38DRAFT_1202632 [Terfezia claveryi]|nr:hypothetical protein BGX38DRAFT_1202632 [Terfezia claveryi]
MTEDEIRHSRGKGYIRRTMGWQDCTRLLFLWSLILISRSFVWSPCWSVGQAPAVVPLFEKYVHIHKNIPTYLPHASCSQHPSLGLMHTGLAYQIRVIPDSGYVFHIDRVFLPDGANSHLMSATEFTQGHWLRTAHQPQIQSHIQEPYQYSNPQINGFVRIHAAPRLL